MYPGHRNSQQVVSIQKALQLNDNIDKLKSNYTVDTTNKNPEEVAGLIKVKILDFEAGGKKND